MPLAKAVVWLMASDTPGKVACSGLSATAVYDSRSSWISSSLSSLLSVGRISCSASTGLKKDYAFKMLADFMMKFWVIFSFSEIYYVIAT